MIDWNYIHREWDWAGHIVSALAIAVVVSLLFRISIPARAAWIAGLSFGMGHYHGREKRDYEIAAKLQPPHIEGHFFWNWSWDNLTDFWPTAIVCTIAIISISRRNSPKT